MMFKLQNTTYNLHVQNGKIKMKLFALYVQNIPVLCCTRNKCSVDIEFNLLTLRISIIFILLYYVRPVYAGVKCSSKL